MVKVSHNGKVAGSHYFVSTQGPVAIVTFVGDLNSSAVEMLGKCRIELVAVKVKFLVFYFRDVETITGDSIQSLTQIQLDARGRELEIRMTSIKPNIKEKLLKMGVVRGDELANNLRDALMAFVPAAAGGTRLKAS